MSLILSLHRFLIVIFYVLAVVMLAGLVGFTGAGGSPSEFLARLEWQNVAIFSSVIGFILILGACASFLQAGGSDASTEHAAPDDV